MIGKLVSYVISFLAGAAAVLSILHLSPYTWSLIGAFIVGVFITLAIVVWFLNDTDIGPRF